MPDILKKQFQLRAADDALARQNQKSGGDYFDEPLQAIPMSLRDFAQLLAWIEDEIENHQREIAVPQKQIGRLDRVGGVLTASPEQIGQNNRSGCVRIERILPIHQRHKKAVVMRVP